MKAICDDDCLSDNAIERSSAARRLESALRWLRPGEHRIQVANEAVMWMSKQQCNGE